MVKNYSMLKKIKIKGYKALKDVEINLRSLNIIVGENGTGKTSILECVYYIFRGDMTDLAMSSATINLDSPRIFTEFYFEGKYYILDEVEKPRQPDSDKFGAYIVDPIFRFNYENNEAIGEIKFKDQEIVYYVKDKTGEQQLTRTFSIRSLYSSSLKKRTDWLLITNDSIQRRILNIKQLAFFTYLQNTQSIFFTEQIQGLVVHGSRTTKDKDPIRIFSSFNYMYNDVAFSMRYNYTTPSQIVFIRANRIVSGTQPKLLANIPRNWEQRRDGNSLISYLHYLADPEFQHNLTKVNDWAQKFGLKDMKSILREEYKINLKYRNETFDGQIDVALGGLGMGQLLFLIVECVVAEPGTIILVDEPEVHLHAKYQALLLDLFIETIQRGVQLILATHSEYLILRLQRRISEKHLDSDQTLVIETQLEKEKGVIIKELEFDDKGYYKDESPSVIQFAQEEYQKWAKNNQMKKE